MADALKVWDAATTAEKAELSQEFIRKKTAYMKRSYNADPEARAKDRVYKRLVGMFSEGQPGPASATVSSSDSVGLQSLRE